METKPRYTLKSSTNIITLLKLRNIFFHFSIFIALIVMI